jgi:tetratricopeptide (TPR) repeat protein
MRGAFQSQFDDPYSVSRRRRRVGGWAVAFVLMLAVGVVGWIVAKPYLVGRNAGAAAQLDPRAQSFVASGERAMTDGNLDLAQEDFDKASALAEKDPRVLLDEARVAAAKADVPWLKLRLLSPDASDELRTTKAQLDERVARAGRAADEALASAPEDAAAVRAKIDALRLAGDRDAARSYVSRVIAQASLPETAYALAALDLAEPEPLWTTVVDRLRLAAAGEGGAGRARAALAYALQKSGDAPGAKAELAKLDALTRTYPLAPNLHAFIDGSAHKAAPDAGVAAANPPTHVELNAPSPQAGAAPTSQAGGNGEGVPSDARGGLHAAAQAIKKGDWNRARQIYEAIAARNPSDSEALAGLGDTARAQGDSAAAITAYKRAIAVNPSYLPALLGLADTEWVGGDRASAVRTYKDVVNRFPEGTYAAYVKQRAEGSSPGAGPNGQPATTAPVAPANPASPAGPPNELSE